MKTIYEIYLGAGKFQYATKPNPQYLNITYHAIQEGDITHLYASNQNRDYFKSIPTNSIITHSNPTEPPEFKAHC